MSRRRACSAARRSERSGKEWRPSWHKLKTWPYRRNAANRRKALKLNFLSHGTLESHDLAFSRRFYEQFLGLEVLQTSPISLLIRLGGPNKIAVVYSKNVGGMNLLNHNGLDVRTREEVDEAHRIVCAQAAEWRFKKNLETAPSARHVQLLLLGWRR
jgi:hypothetical protein